MMNSFHCGWITLTTVTPGKQYRQSTRQSRIAGTGYRDHTNPPAHAYKRLGGPLMPFIVMVYAPDIDAAQDIMRVIEHHQLAQRKKTPIVGVYRFPSKNEAECPGFRCPQHRDENAFGWGRHHTGQHIVHGACQRRRKGFRARLKVALMDLFGINLLPRDVTPTIFRNPTGYDHLEAFPSIAADR
jgi:hypothetical protein